MNRLNRSGGIRFRDLDYSNSPTKSSTQQSCKPKIRSKNDVLKLFNSSPKKEDFKDENEQENNSVKLKSKTDILKLFDNSSDGLKEIGSDEENVKESENNESTVSLSDSLTKPPDHHSLQKFQQCLKIRTPEAKQTTKHDLTGQQIYNVLVGKISTRKHKQWESEGLLEVCGKSAILKDLDGKIIGRASRKPEQIEEGFRMCIGGKEVEVVDVATQISQNTQNFQDKNDQDNNTVKSKNKTDILKLFSDSRDSLKETVSDEENVKQNENNELKVDLSDMMNKPSDQIKDKNLEVKSDDSSQKFQHCFNIKIPESKQATKHDVTGKLIYNVLVGKISTRKHKQWESDGLLEISGKSAILKELDGKTIGRAAIKPEQIEEGFRMCIGGKEIEIVDIATQVTENTQNFQDESVVQPIKKLKTLKGFVSVKPSSLHFNYKPLIMPNPTMDVDWMEEDLTKIHEVSVDGCLASVLRPHQREGVIFLYKCILGMNNINCHGAILADEMGLGKTLQCITLIWTLLKKGPFGKPILKRVLIVSPSSLCGNWNKEFKRWLGSIKISPYVVEGKNKVKDFLKTPRANVMIISYEMFVRNFEDVNNLNFDLLICDEGHRLKNSEVKTLKFLDQLSCKKRILLTGTPVQNDLQELHTLINFVNPGILGTLSDFRKYYEGKVVAAQCPSAEEDELILGQERANELHERIKPFILRRTNMIINKYLPQKHELVIFCRPTKEQDNLYSLITDYWFNRSLITTNNILPLTIITALKKVCNHPYLFTCEKNDILNEMLPSVPTNLSVINSSFSYSTKFLIVEAVLKELKKTQEKIVLVSYFTQTLNLLEKVCSNLSLGYCRLDGNTITATRTKIVEKFNSAANNNCKVFLLSAKAGGVGLNLIGASRLILFDSDWNPANDAQAMARIWRDGQKKSVYIYRLLTTGTIEEKIYQRQISKTGLSEAVVDLNHSGSLKLSNNELKDLFTLDYKTESVTHDLMECFCDGTGPVSKEDEETAIDDDKDVRDCQLNLKSKKPVKKHTISINQLSSWDHYKQPFCESLMKELMLNEVSKYVTFIFKNSVENSEK